MFSAADLIEALRRRRRTSLRPQRPPGEFPAGWADWFAAMHARVGAVSGAAAAAVIAIFVARELAPPPRATLALNRWQAFNTLWRQQWHPASVDERGTRAIAAVATLLLHLLLALLLAYIAYVRFMAAMAPADAAAAGEDIIEVEYIGAGTAEGGAGAPSGEAKPEHAPAAAAAAMPSPGAPPAVPRPAAMVTPPAAAASAPPQPPSETPVLPVDQPLQVTATQVPDQPFTLPPPRIAVVASLPVAAPELSAAPREVRSLDVPAPLQAPQPRVLAQPAMAAPQLQQRPAEVAVREVGAPLPTVQMRDLPPRPTTPPQLQARAPGVSMRAIPTPAARPGAATPAPAGTSDSGAATKAGTATAAGAHHASAGTRPAAAASGSGQAPSPRPGGLASPRRGDDWGVSARNRPGGNAGNAAGLFNSDGSPKLASGDGKVGGGLPPGTITEDFAKIDRHGTWLKRPPTDYTPTRFDQFWVPNETLLQEWVRRSIKEVLIPIPGTSKKIRCMVVVLALGGGCGITDPDLQDVEATARKPPEVPFKRELQENQDALGP